MNKDQQVIRISRSVSLTFPETISQNKSFKFGIEQFFHVTFLDRPQKKILLQSKFNLKTIEFVITLTCAFVPHVGFPSNYPRHSGLFRKFLPQFEYFVLEVRSWRKKITKNA